MAPRRAGVFLASIRLRIPASRNRRVIVLLGLLGLVKVRAHYALAGLATALLVALVVYRMPGGTATATLAHGLTWAHNRGDWRQGEQADVRGDVEQ
jgi:hypothetical protein